MSNLLGPSYLYKGGSRWLLLAGAVIALDQWTKSMITARLDEFESVVLLPVLDFMRLHNEGAAFSLLSDASGWQRWFFILVGFAVSAGIFFWIRSLPSKGQYLLAAALSLVMGGALGNVIDRILLGHVVDFIRVHYRGSYFPAFNVADSAITIGAGLLMLDSLLQSYPKARGSENSKAYTASKSKSLSKKKVQKKPRTKSKKVKTKKNVSKKKVPKKPRTEKVATKKNATKKKKGSR